MPRTPQVATCMSASSSKRRPRFCRDRQPSSAHGRDHARRSRRRRRTPLDRRPRQSRLVRATRTARATASSRTAQWCNREVQRTTRSPRSKHVTGYAAHDWVCLLRRWYSSATRAANQARDSAGGARTGRLCVRLNHRSSMHPPRVCMQSDRLNAQDVVAIIKE